MNIQDKNFDTANILIDLDQFANNYGLQQARNLALYYVERSYQDQNNTSIKGNAPDVCDVGTTTNRCRL